MRQLCETGKGNLQWERDIPPAALSNLENLAKTDFKANLGKIIHDIYQTAHQMFSDMPQGPQEACQVQVCLQDPDEDLAQLREGRDRGSDREEGHLPGPLRNPWQVHMETRLILSILCRNYERVFKLKLI